MRHDSFRKLRRSLSMANHASVSTQLTYRLILIVLIMAASSLIAILRIGRTSASISEDLSEASPLIEASAAIRLGSAAASEAVLMYRLSNDTNALRVRDAALEETGRQAEQFRLRAASHADTLRAATIMLAVSRLDTAVRTAADNRTPTAAAPSADAMQHMIRMRDELDDYLHASVEGPLKRRNEAVVDEALARGRWQQALLLTAFLAGLFFSAWTAERARDGINKPLQVLMRGARRINTGQNAVLSLPRAGSEFRLLARVFNKMVQSLEDSRLMLAGALKRAEAASEAKSSFVSDVSHEMRTPLTSLRGSLVLLMNRAVPAGSEAEARLLRIAVNNTDRLLRMIDNRLDLDRIESGNLRLELEHVDPERIISESVENVASLADSSDVRLLTSADGIPVLADRDRLVQVMVNLLANSIRFSPTGSAVSISAARCDSGVSFEVQDEGPGFSPADRERVFQRFWSGSADDPRTGTGLGLHIARVIVEEHGGTISAHAGANGGALVRVTIPEAPAETWGAQSTGTRATAVISPR